ncbi:hypothetical protein OH76DRAFT_1483352 [Lentinus brumalis]|uniref:DUF6533 domain-containing protein n=1 Tax=Lentinus brumalis TaxID=2498619 RepID=A0A371D9C9_9APHY|nr:hypothetical protein OH76DRAFT_1483352 [Polyporus brumalis]
MSSDEGGRAAAIVDLYSIVSTGNYCDVATSVLFIYDAIVTFNREVACFFSTGPTGASFLFFANKGVSLTFYVMQLIGFMAYPSTQVGVTAQEYLLMVDRHLHAFSCASYSQALHAMLVLQMIPWAVFAALRAFVLSKSKLLGLLVLTLSAAPAAANLVPFGYGLSGVILAEYGLGCLSTDNTTPDITLKYDLRWLVVYAVKLAAYQATNTVTIISRAPLIAADILLICITWSKLSSRDTLKVIRQSKRLTLSDMILRDGTVYFIVLSLLNILHLTLSLLSATINGTGSSFVTLFTAPITAILVSRFLLELQEANRMVVRLDPDDPLYSSRSPYESDTPSFISSLGGFINPDVPMPSDVSLDSHADSRPDREEEREA